MSAHQSYKWVGRLAKQRADSGGSAQNNVDETEEVDQILFGYVTKGVRNRAGGGFGGAQRAGYDMIGVEADISSRRLEKF